jgi:hypothetical protein
VQAHGNFASQRIARLASPYRHAVETAARLHNDRPGHFFAPQKIRCGHLCAWFWAASNARRLFLAPLPANRLWTPTGASGRTKGRFGAPRRLRRLYDFYLEIASYLDRKDPIKTPRSDSISLTFAISLATKKCMKVFLKPCVNIFLRRSPGASAPSRIQRAAIRTNKNLNI